MYTQAIFIPVAYNNFPAHTYVVTQVNHLGHFLLTLELLPLLQTTARETGDVRVVCVSSVLHSSGEWEPDNMNAERDYSRLGFYRKSKLYNVSAM